MAPSLPSFTKDGTVPQYRMVISVAIDYEVVEEMGYATAAAQVEEQFRPVFEQMGLQYVTTTPDLDFEEQTVFSMRAASSLPQLDADFLLISDEHQIYFTVYDLEGLVSQGYDFGNYDTGTTNMVSEDIAMYNNSTQQMLKTHASDFEETKT